MISRGYHEFTVGVCRELRGYEVHRFPRDKFTIKKVARDYDYIIFFHLRIHHGGGEGPAELVSSRLRFLRVEKREGGIEMNIRYVKYFCHLSAPLTLILRYRYHAVKLYSPPQSSKPASFPTTVQGSISLAFTPLSVSASKYFDGR